MESFMLEVEKQMFDPADQMIVPFDLKMNMDSEGIWKTSITIYWIMVGGIAVGSAYDIWRFYKDTLEGRIVKFGEDFESGAEYNKAGENNNKAGVVEMNNNDNITSTTTAGKNARARGNTDFSRDVAADLANLGIEAEEPIINENELALM